MSKAHIESTENYVRRASLEERDLERFLSREDVVSQTRSGLRSDSADTAIFLRQLTDIIVPTFDIKYVENMARTLIPVDMSVNPGANDLVWRQFDKVGEAKVVNSYEASDFPNVEVIGKEYRTRIVSVGASFQYSFQDLRAASMANLPLEQRKALAARFAVERTLETIASVGMTGSHGTYATNSSDTAPIYGLSNFPNIGATAGTGGSAGYTTLNWIGGSATVSGILADVNAMVRQIFDVSGGIHKPNTLVLPTKLYSYLASTSRSPTFTDDSILQYILKQVPFLETIEFWPFLDLAGKLQDTTTAGPRIMMYEKKPENMSLVIPQDFEMFAPQMDGAKFKIMCHMRTAGVVVHYPKSIAYLDGATG